MTFAGLLEFLIEFGFLSDNLSFLLLAIVDYTLGDSFIVGAGLVLDARYLNSALLVCNLKLVAEFGGLALLDERFFGGAANAAISAQLHFLSGFTCDILLL